MKALTIDDDPHFLKILELHLRNIGYTTTAIQTPGGILKAISEGKYDLILVDWMIPEVDGITERFAWIVTANFAASHTAAIASSGRSSRYRACRSPPP